MGYSTLKIYGDCDVNYVLSKRESLSPKDIRHYADNGIFTPIWDSTTIALSDFNNNISGSVLKQPIEGYLIHRQRKGDNTRNLVAKVSAEVTSIKDFNIGSKASYEYYITPLYSENGETVLGRPIVSDVTNTNFNAWSVIGLLPTDNPNEYVVDKDNVWSFELNVQGEDYIQNFDTITSDGLGQFPKVYSGDKNYLSSGFSCYLGNISCANTYLDDDIDKLNKWNTFCSNGNLKLLKDIKGHIIFCVFTFASHNSEENIIEMPTTISVKFTQVANSGNIMVYTTDDL